VRLEVEELRQLSDLDMTTVARTLCFDALDDRQNYAELRVGWHVIEVAA
jgi:hypothetical protein